MAADASISGQSVEVSDDDSFELESESRPTSAALTSQDAIKGEVNDDDTDEGVPKALNMPVQKRRRVTRACDECRRKKIKCDGKNPCTHCSVYSYGNLGLRSSCVNFFYN